MLEGCSDQCGWMFGIIAALSFGSFGVPIKYINNVDVDPLVMQSYKSIVCFLTCWLVIPLGNVPIRFTYWGIISGLFWVPGATAGIYGIRNAGLAVSVGTWSAIIVISSFCWGIFVFHEPVKNVERTFCAAVVLICGLVGMSRYSEPVKKVEKADGVDFSEDDNQHRRRLSDIFFLDDDDVGGSGESDEEKHCENSRIVDPLLKNAKMIHDVESVSSLDGIEMTIGTKRRVVKVENSHGGTEVGTNHHDSSPINNISNDEEVAKTPKKLNLQDKSIAKNNTTSDAKTKKGSNATMENDNIQTPIISLTRRQLGIFGAVINGAWGGNSVIPMHFARNQGFFGANYLISFSVGSMIVTVMMWAIRYMYNLYYHRGNVMKAYNCLPSFYIREIGIQGFLAGALYSLGNFCSIITVSILGQGVGYSFIQTSMLISGLWGIFFFQEVQGREIILKWFCSSFVTITGILWLSYEHEGSSSH